MSDSDSSITYQEAEERWIGIDWKMPMPQSIWDLQDQSVYDLNSLQEWLDDGLDPNELQEGETLYEYELWKLREGESDDYDFRRVLVQLLLAYGCSSPTYRYTWRFKEPDFDIKALAELKNYDMHFRKVDNKYSREGYIINKETGEEIAWL